MKKISIVALLCIALFAGIFVFLSQEKHSEDVHFHAGFLVYKDGVKQDYSDPQYMHVEVCTTKDTPHTLPLKDDDIIHLHNGEGTVAHIHGEGATWKMLLTNLGEQISVKAKVVGYINGRLSSNILTGEIHPMDSVLILIGKSDSVKSDTAVSKKYIQEVEKKTESCN